MADTPIMYWQEKLGKTQVRQLRIVWTTSSGTFTEKLPGNPIYFTQGAIATQSVIDNFLGTSSEFDYLAFDATSMGTDAVGVIIDMKGQAAKVSHATLDAYSGTHGVTLAGARTLTTAITATTLETAVACGASATITGSGNLAFKGVISGLDSHTGVVVLTVNWISK